ncbi:MAG: AsnC family transcriptional regulator [Phycisphaerae bacterium]|jgi:Rrf2 family protein|nr:MAG: AsnC family transcriptional regulator [Phycisphaerae bacterium]
MRLSKRTEYGLRAIVQLAKLWPTQYIQSRDLSDQENLPNKFLESILLALKRGGFLESKVGSGGGYRLSRAPREIMVGDVIRRLEGRLSARDQESPRETAAGEVAVHLINQKLTQATDKVLDSITLEELLDEVNKTTGGHQEMYYI